MCSFFLPAVRACNAAVVPAEDVYGALTDPVLDLAEWAAIFLVYIAAYLFGLLVLVTALRKPAATGGERQGVSLAVLFGVVALLILGLALLDLRGGLSQDFAGGVLYLIVFLSLAYFVRSVRLGAGGLLCLRWYTATLCLAWFGLWVASGDALFGLYVSLGGSAFILVGCTVEARHRSQLPYPATVWALMLCRVRLYDTGEPRCLRCGYLLHGLSIPRCPECGQPFEQVAQTVSTPGATSP